MFTPQNMPEETQSPKETNVFVFTAEDGTNVRLAVERLRSWAEQNLPVVDVYLDLRKIETILRSEQVSIDELLAKKQKNDKLPILVALNFKNGETEIVDGRHIYLAAAFAALKAKSAGRRFSNAVSAYCIQRSDWMRFLEHSE